MAASFSNRDPSAPEFWSERFEQAFTPWDRGDVPANLRQFVEQSGRQYTTLIPGCGTGYEVAYLAQAGWDVTAIDFSPAAVAAARAVLGSWAELVQEADFFTYQPPKPLELIYERAFLCALPREKWPAIVRRWAQLLPEGGLLTGFFYFDNAEKGPPFGADRSALEALLAPWFERLDDREVTDSIPIFAGKERWQLWRRRASAPSAE